MRCVLVLLRWCAIVAPIVATATWVRATSARGGNPGLAAGFATPMHSAHVELPGRPAVRMTPDLPAAEPARDSTAANDDPCAASDLAPTTDRTVQEIFSGPADTYGVALTFDDGPSRENTPRILQVLAEHDVRATFFVLGNRAEHMPDLLQQVDEAGHELANHGHSHASLRSLLPVQIRDEICRTQRAIDSATGKRPALFRPPFGRYAESAVGLVGALGYDIVLWDIDGEDWRFDDPTQMAQHVVESAHSGSIILLHDRESITVHALPAIIIGLQRRGLRIVPVSELTSLGPYQH